MGGAYGNLVIPLDCIHYSDSDSILVCLTQSKKKEGNKVQNIGEKKKTIHSSCEEEG